MTCRGLTNADIYSFACVRIANPAIEGWNWVNGSDGLDIQVRCLYLMEPLALGRGSESLDLRH